MDAISGRLEGSPGGGSHVTLGRQQLSLDGDGGAGPEAAARREIGDGDAAVRDALAVLADRIESGAEGGALTHREESEPSDGWMPSAARTAREA